MSSLDDEDIFLQYLRSEEVEATGASLGICLRETHRIHPKVCQETDLIDRYVVRLTCHNQRVGVPLQIPDQKLPDISKDEFYDLCEPLFVVSWKRMSTESHLTLIVTIGGADLAIRFAEFECVACSDLPGNPGT